MATLVSMLDTYKVEKKPLDGLKSEPTDTKAVPPIPGGGLTRRMLTSLESGTGNVEKGTWTIPIVTILQYVFEGDNRGDAGMLLAIINKALDLQIKGMSIICHIFNLTHYI